MILLFIILICKWMNSSSVEVIEYRNYYARRDRKGDWTYHEKGTNRQIGYRDRGMAYIEWFTEEE
ncbi:MAG: hypothetical protein IJM15_00865 [Erysipelotrichaceae bacterium]|nr:hypothetical protein [Erysipelotrichaceae bacterium]